LGPAPAGIFGLPNQLINSSTFDPKMKMLTEVVFALRGDHRYRGRNRLCGPAKADCDCDPDTDTDTDEYRVFLSF
jgi:hypothetical protein